MLRPSRNRWWLCGWFFLVAGLSLAAAEYRVRWQRADPSALGVVATFPLPEGAARSGTLDITGGPRLQYQVDAQGFASVLLPDSLSGKAFEGRLRPTGQPGPPAIVTDRSGQTIRWRAGDRELLRYQAEPGEFPRPGIDPLYRRGGYLHPIFSPSGQLVSDDFPPNHIHHHGIWSPWTKTQFEGRDPDFWNMGQGKGHVEFVAVDALASGPVFGALKARHRFVDSVAKPEKPVLDETWEVRVYAFQKLAGRPCTVFDLTLTQACVGQSPLQLPKYHYGGLGFRGHRDWDGATNCHFLTATGETNRIQGNETRANWCWMGGKAGPDLSGVTVMDHPDNFRSPQPMRLHPTEPFFCYAPSQGGDWEIAPGRPYTARYRFVVTDGPPDRVWLHRVWAGFAAPSRPTVVTE